MASGEEGGLPAVRGRRRVGVRGAPIAAPALERAEYTLDQLLDEVVGPSADLRAVDVHKLRRRFTIGGCMTEWTDVRADGSTTRTIAVETEDAARVIATVRELGLESRPNTSYPRGLKALLGFGAS